MADAKRRSLSPEEHAIRIAFDAATRDHDEERRAKLWTKLKQARARGARQKERLFVRVRLNDRLSTLAACLISDLKIVSLRPLKGPFGSVNRVEAYAPCELLFGPTLAPCTRPGPCPHEVVVYVLKSDNESVPLDRRAHDALRSMVERRPTMHTP